MEELVGVIFIIAFAIFALSWVWQHLGQIVWVLFIYLGPIALPFLTYHFLRVWHALTSTSIFRTNNNAPSLIAEFKRFTPSPFAFMDENLDKAARQRCSELGHEIGLLRSEQERLITVLRTHTGKANPEEVYALWRTHKHDPAILDALIQHTRGRLGVYE